MTKEEIIKATIIGEEFEDIEEIEHEYIYGLTENEEKIDDRVSKFEEKINQLIKNQKKIIEKLNKNNNTQ